jgi:UDP-3-O-[3-hydroxymyristoyl] glucosamine N-acyltransferase
MPAESLGSIAQRLGGQLQGNPELPIRGVRALEEAGPGDIGIVMDRKRYASCVASLRASALVLPPDVLVGPEGPHDFIRVENPRRALMDLLTLFHPPRRRRPERQPGALISPEALVAPDAFVASGATIEAGARVGARSEIHAYACVGEGVEIGEDTIVYPHVVLYPGSRIGNRVRIHAGTVIGSEGFGFPRQKDGTLRRIPQVGIVEIEDDVEIGANSTIDRATLEKTIVGRGTKIDNLVQIGHNSRIGRDCCIMGQVGISGSVRVGDFATLCGQVGIADNVTLADRAVVGAQSGVPQDVTEGVWLGTPALPAAQMRRIFAALTRLPDSLKELRALRQRCADLESRLARIEEERAGSGHSID